MTYYHAAADEPTPTELKLLGAEKSSGPVRVANFIQRLTGMGQIAEAARFYRTYLQASPDKKREMEPRYSTSRRKQSAPVARPYSRRNFSRKHPR